MTELKWQAGQRAVIDRQRIVTIERVTPSGRAVAGGKMFSPDGSERGAGYRPARLELLTPEISAEMELVERGGVVAREVFLTIRDIDTWVRRNFPAWGLKMTPEIADVEKAERLVNAIREAMKETP